MEGFELLHLHCQVLLHDCDCILSAGFLFLVFFHFVNLLQVKIRYFVEEKHAVDVVQIVLVAVVDIDQRINRVLLLDDLLGNLIVHGGSH